MEIVRRATFLSLSLSPFIRPSRLLINPGGFSTSPDKLGQGQKSTIGPVTEKGTQAEQKKAQCAKAIMGVRRRPLNRTDTPVHIIRTLPRGMETCQESHTAETKQAELHHHQVQPHHQPTQLPRQGVQEGSSRHAIRVVRGQPPPPRRPNGHQTSKKGH